MESAELNYLKWYNNENLKQKERFLNQVDIVINYVEKRFDKLTYLINNYNYNNSVSMVNYYIILVSLLLFF